MIQVLFRTGLPRFTCWFVVALLLGLITGIPASAQSPSTTEANKANKALVQQFLSAMEQGDLANRNALSAPTVSMHGSTGDRVSTTDPADDLATACPMCAALEDRRIVIDVILAEGDLVAVRSTWSGLYSGNYRGLTVATPRRISVHYTNIYRIAGGRIVENWFATDRLALAEQLGYTLTPPGDARP